MFAVPEEVQLVHACLFGCVIDGVHATLEAQSLNFEMASWTSGIFARLGEHVQLALTRGRGRSRDDEDELAIDRRCAEGGTEDGYVVARRIVRLVDCGGCVGGGGGGEVPRESLV